MPLDVASSGLGSYAGRAVRLGITCSALPTGPLAKKDETFWRKNDISASGLEQKLTDRFDDKTYYTS